MFLVLSKRSQTLLFLPAQNQAKAIYDGGIGISSGEDQARARGGLWGVGNAVSSSAHRSSAMFTP